MAQVESVRPDPDGLAGSVGQLVGDRFRLEYLLGRGGMGEVWRALHLVTRRPAAIKLLRNTLAHRVDMRQRFLREARAAGAVSHPNVAEVLDAFTIEDGTLVLVMPLLEGETLRALIAREAPLPLEAALEVLLPLISAVGTAHSRGVVHRDLKPENVFLARDAGGCTLKVLDFGIAKLMSEDANDDVTLTGVGVLLGTPYYMAPEQGYGERDQDYRADIWSIGVIAYELLCGSRPIEGENTSRVLRNLLTQGITPIEQLAPELPEHVSRLVMTMLARERSQRPQSLRDVYLALDPQPPGSAPSHALPGEPIVASTDHGGDGLSQTPTQAVSPRPGAETTGGAGLKPLLANLGRLLGFGRTAAAESDTLVSQVQKPAAPDSANARTLMEATAEVRRSRSRGARILGLFVAASVVAFAGLGLWLVRPDAGSMVAPVPPAESRPAAAPAPAPAAATTVSPADELSAGPSAAPSGKQPVAIWRKKRSVKKRPSRPLFEENPYRR